MLAALLAGERDPKTLAALALGVLRRKQSPLDLALTGQFTEHHAWLIQGALELIDLLDRQLTDLDRSGAISPFIWWHDGECGGWEEIWPMNQGLAGVQGNPFLRFWVALKREQARLLKHLRGV
jgi:hypothetical protein